MFGFRAWLFAPLIRHLQGHIMLKTEFVAGLQAVADQLTASNAVLAEKLAATTSTTPDEDAALANVKAAADALSATIA